ncbi:MarR family transcriptional regulator, partial [Cellulomonas sp. 179-A 4D5 NHS]
LADEPGGWIDLIEPARGERADLYALIIPTDLAGTAADLRWDRGHAHALRPAFRELGHAAAFVFEAVEAGRATTITTLVPVTGLHRDTVARAVEVLAAHGLLERSPTGLSAQPGRLRAVAELLGTLDAVIAQLRRYVRDRELWRAYLTRHDPEQREPAPGDVEDYWWPPDDETWTLTHALHHVA